MLRVLIVDNEPRIRLTLRDYLIAGEFEAHEAADVDQGLKILREKPIDVVVSEINLPRVRGLELPH